MLNECTVSGVSVGAARCELNRVLGEVECAAAAPVLEPHHAPLGDRARDDVVVAVAVEIDRLRIDRPRHLRQHVLHPGRVLERVTGEREERDFLRLLPRAGGVLSALVRRDHLGPTVAVQIREEHSDERAAVARNGGDVPPPCRGGAGGTRAGILEIDKVRELARGDDIEPAVAVQVRDRDVFGRTRLGAFDERDGIPDGGISRAECHAHVPFRRAVVLIVRLVRRDDVEMAVSVEVGHDETVAAAQRDTGRHLVVDQVLAPRDICAAGGARRGWSIGER